MNISGKAVIAIRAVALSMGLGLVVLGILSRETVEIMQKAVVICLECIGIG
jgi:hypothetical protein